MLFLNLSARARRFTASWGIALPICALALSPIACSSDEPSPVISPDPDPVDKGSEVTVVFEPTTTLTLAPEEVATLTVRVTPNQRQAVTFEILTEDSSFDGFLSESEAQAKDDGTASVTIQAPSEPSLFTVRASVDAEHAATRAISVSAHGYGTLQVEPRYEGGRNIEQWTASARADANCDDLDNFFDDGPLAATGSRFATIPDVPTGVPIALTVRGGLLASGCATISDLGTETLEEVIIEVSDRPMDLESGVLAITLGIDSSTTDFASHLESVVTESSSYYWNQEESEGAALIALMAEELEGQDQSDFIDASKLHDFPAVVDLLYKSKSPMSAQIANLLTEAAGTISGDEVFKGELELDGETSQFLLTEAAAVPAAISGFLQGSRWMASAESDDKLVLGGGLTYEPIRWLVAIAEQSAMVDAEPQALVVQAGRCEDVAEALVMAASGNTHGSCDEDCVSALCEAALAPVWEELRTAGNGLSTLQVAASGGVEFYGAAQILSVDGSWVGRIDEDETSIKGPAGAELRVDD